MNRDYFEINELNPDQVLDLNPEDYLCKDEPEAPELREEEKPSGLTEEQDFQTEESIVSLQKMTVLLTVLALAAVLIAGGIILWLSAKKGGEIDATLIPGGASSLTESDSSGIGRITENVIGTGALLSDCDVRKEPDRASEVAGRLMGGTEVLIYAAEGDYYKISDSQRMLVGYVLKVKVNTGDAGSGNP